MPGVVYPLEALKIALAYCELAMLSRQSPGMMQVKPGPVRVQDLLNDDEV